MLEIDIIRHAQKGPDGQLTQEGRANAMAVGANFLFDGRRIKVYTSDIQRAIDTGDLLSHAANVFYARRTRDFLSEAPYTDERISQLSLDGGLWLLLNEGREDLPPSKVIAGKIAKFILEQEKLAQRVDNPEDFHIIAVTHVPPLMLFLSHVSAHEMGKENIDGEVVKKVRATIGSGIPQPLTGFKVGILEDGNISLTVGETTTSLDRGFLQALQMTHDEWIAEN